MESENDNDISGNTEGVATNDESLVQENVEVNETEVVQAETEDAKGDDHDPREETTEQENHDEKVNNDEKVEETSEQENNKEQIEQETTEHENTNENEEEYVERDEQENVETEEYNEEEEEEEEQEEVAEEQYQVRYSSQGPPPPPPPPKAEAATIPRPPPPPPAMKVDQSPPRQLSSDIHVENNPLLALSSTFKKTVSIKQSDSFIDCRESGSSEKIGEDDDIIPSPVNTTPTPSSKDGKSTPVPASKKKFSKFISSVFSSKSNNSAASNTTNTAASAASATTLTSPDNNNDNELDEDDDDGGMEDDTSGNKRHILHFITKGLIGKKSIDVNLYKSRIIEHHELGKSSFKCKKFTKVSIDNTSVTIHLSGKVNSKTFYLETAEEADRLYKYIEYMIDSGLHLKRIYDCIDSEKKGFFTMIQLLRCLRSVGLPYHKEVLDKMLRCAMSESQDTVDFYGFFHVLLSVPCADLHSCLYEWYARAHEIDFYPLELLEGEVVTSPEEIVYYTACAGKNYQNSPFIKGKLVLTNYRFYFRSYEAIEEGHPPTRFSIPQRFRKISLPYASIHKLKITTEGMNVLNIINENFFTIFLFFPKSFTNLSRIETILSKVNIVLNQDDSRKLTFAFNYKLYETVDYGNGIWLNEYLNEEYKRQGLNEQSPWKIIPNENYALCPSYPPFLVVPAACNSSHIRGSVKYRSSGRFPVVTYIYETSVVLVRCAQPLAGVFRKSSMDDVHLLNLFRLKGNADNHNDGKNRFYIVDARGMVASSANALMGKGTENVNTFTDTELVYGCVDNIHEMRNCAKQLSESLSPTFDPLGDIKDILIPSDTNNAIIESWLKHVRQILALAVFVIEKMVLEESSVLVHCSDGWDRTTQICAIAQLLLDPYYRTIDGFAVLIEKDWCAFGHKFHDRFGRNRDKPDERSPIFLQFLDCVSQIMNQFPTSFEFHQDYLIFLSDHSISGLFGNFIGNNEKERIQIYNVTTTTSSIWNYVFARREQFINHSYNANGERVLWPSVLLYEMRLWSRFWCRWNLSSNPRNATQAWKEDW